MKWPGVGLQMEDQGIRGGFSGWNGREMVKGIGCVLGELGGVIGREMEV